MNEDNCLPEKKDIIRNILNEHYNEFKSIAHEISEVNAFKGEVEINLDGVVFVIKF